MTGLRPGRPTRVAHEDLQPTRVGALQQSDRIISPAADAEEPDWARGRALACAHESPLMPDTALPDYADAFLDLLSDLDLTCPAQAWARGRADPTPYRRTCRHFISDRPHRQPPDDARPQAGARVRICVGLTDIAA